MPENRQVWMLVTKDWRELDRGPSWEAIRLAWFLAGKLYRDAHGIARTTDTREQVWFKDGYGQ